jgi:hypothetical protein
MCLLSMIVLLPSIAFTILVMKPSAGMFAFMMNYIMMLSGDISEFLDTLSNNENRLISLERCITYMDVEPEEGYKNLKELEQKVKAK